MAIQSNSNISGDKTENTISGVVGDMDYWLVKVDHLGNIEWQNTLGGIHADLCYDVVLTTSGGYAVAGHSLSGVSGDKTNANWGDTYDYWAVGVDSLGLVIWDKTYGGLNEDYGYAMSGNENGQFIIAGNSASGISGDRTEASYGVYDFWLIKFRPVCDSTGEVCNTLDDDCDGLIDESVIEDIYIYNLGETSVCQGAGVTMFAEYTGASVQWTRNGIPLPGATGPGYVALASGNYACITTSDCGEATSNAIHVTINKKPKAKVVAGGPTTFCDGDFVYLNELPTAGCTYLWQKDGTSIPGAVLNTYVATTTGNYRCIVTKTETGCFNTSNSIIVTVDCKVGEIQTLELSIYPNPASSNITIKTNNTDPKTISIFNAVGALVYNTLSVEENVLVAINHLPAGVYYVDMAAEYGKGNCTFVKE
ncbi:MAG: T9SS type A sorting domain-containing protein [Chitinophagales bacterium]